MPQVPRAVKNQVLAETQRLAQLAKTTTGLSDDKIEEKLSIAGVMKSKNGYDFAAFRHGEKSKLSGIFNFRKKLEEAGFLPPAPDPKSVMGMLHAMYPEPSKSVVDFAEEVKKFRDFYDARKRAVDALRELERTINQPGIWASNQIHTTSLDQQMEFIERFEQRGGVSHYATRDLENPATQLGSWADRIQNLLLYSISSWDLSKVEDERGAKVVQSNSKNDDKSSKLKPTKKTKSL